MISDSPSTNVTVVRTSQQANLCQHWWKRRWMFVVHLAFYSPDRAFEFFGQSVPIEFRLNVVSRRRFGQPKNLFEIRAEIPVVLVGRATAIPDYRLK